MRMKTPEERKAIAAKAHATRRKNKEAIEKRKAEERSGLLAIRQEVAELELQRGELQTQQILGAEAARLTGKTLLREKEIVAGSMPVDKVCGVYFLIQSQRVVYVGQSVNVFSRILNHQAGKDFDSFAYIPCSPDILDRLESLYIHTLRPPLNGCAQDGTISAPLSLAELLSWSGGVMR